jgi:hypothetical protein
MKEDERILNAITPIVNARKTHKDDNLYSLQLNSYQLDMLQGLLDLYTKEKEKNKKIEDKIKEKITYLQSLEFEDKLVSQWVANAATISVLQSLEE